MKRISPFTVLFIILSAGVIACNILYRQAETAKTPPGTLNTHAIGNFDDYHQYMMIIKTGRQGKLLYHSAFSEENIPDVFLQPFYTLSGYLSRPFDVSLYDIYFRLHLLSLVILYISVYKAVRKLFSGTAGRILAVLFFFSSTGWWFPVSFHPFGIAKHFLPYANFDIFLKFLVIPPHHNIAIACFIGILLSFAGKQNMKTRTVAAGLFIIMSSIHPYIMYISWIILATHTVLSCVRKKALHTPESAAFVFITALSLPGIAFTVYTHAFVLRWDIGNAGILSYLPRAETFAAYIQALGPMLVLAMPVLFRRLSYGNPLIRLLILWAFLPVALFFLPDLHIPFNTWRLFQIYQQIPLSLLAAYSVSVLFRRTSAYPVIAVIIGGISLMYGGISLLWTDSGYTNAPPILVINRYVPLSVVDLFSFLRSHTPDHSVVIAGGVVSNLLPSFTHNHVVIGHNGDNRNFLAKQKEIGEFLGNKIPQAQVRALLSRYHASYIVFGIDAPAFSETPYASLPYLKEIYSANGMSVVEVLR